MRRKLLFLAPLYLMSTTSALAVPFDSFDARTFAMGGAGVAAGNGENASFLNPALLAAQPDSNDFSLAVPVLGVRVADPDDLVTSLDDFQSNNNTDAFGNAIDTFNANKNVTNAEAVVNTGAALLEDFLSIANKAIQGQGNAGFAIGMPGKSLGFSVYGNMWAVGGGVLDITQHDRDEVNTRVDAVEAALNNSNPDTAVAALNAISDPTEAFTSSVQGRGAVITEYGVSLARQFSIADKNIAFGITPKRVKVQTFDYALDVNTAEMSVDEGEKSYSSFNFDAGAVMNFTGGWQAGLVVKNLISKNYETALGNTVKVGQQARVGIAKHSSFYTLTADMDLTENAPAGFDSDTRFLAVGGELKVWKLMQLRAGYRHNIADSTTSIVTAGLGMSLFAAHLDVSLAGSSNEIGVATQLGLNF